MPESTRIHESWLRAATEATKNTRGAHKFHIPIPILYSYIAAIYLHPKRLNAEQQPKNHQKSTRTEGKSSSSGAVAPLPFPIPHSHPRYLFVWCPQKGTKLIHNPSTGAECTCKLDNQEWLSGGTSRDFQLQWVSIFKVTKSYKQGKLFRDHRIENIEIEIIGKPLFSILFKFPTANHQGIIEIAEDFKIR